MGTDQPLHTLDKSLRVTGPYVQSEPCVIISDLRQNKEFVFVSLKKGFDKVISSATISSWIKQTLILCYKLSDQKAFTLHQVKARGVRAFAASKAFQSGVSLEQILSACHWKSRNTFTHFYLKDVTWADSELFHLGPVVAAQQVHHPPPKKRGGNVSILPGNWLMVTDHGLTGFSDPRSNRAFSVCL